MNMGTKEIFAGKIVSKTLMMQHKQKEKMTQEIQIHRSLNHKNVVGFHSFFDDTSNIYIVLELCKKRVGYNLNQFFFISNNLSVPLKIIVNDGTSQAQKSYY